MRLAVRADLCLAARAQFLLAGKRERHPGRRQVEAQRGEKHQASEAPLICKGKSNLDCGIHVLKRQSTGMERRATDAAPDYLWKGD
jgi:hypothetical protein